jgi:hypothetical protein
MTSRSSLLSYNLLGLGGLGFPGLTSRSSLLSYKLLGLGGLSFPEMTSHSSLLSYNLLGLGGLGFPGMTSRSSLLSLLSSASQQEQGNVARSPSAGNTSTSSTNIPLPGPRAS